MATGDISTEPLLNKRFRLLALEGYAISDQIVASTSYYGYVNKDGAWYILKAVDAGSGEINYTYKKGASGYSWANRTDPTFANFADTF